MEQDHFGDLLFFAVFFLIIGFFYVVPTFIAFRRNHPNRWPILLVNVVFGATILGWGIALAWALRAVHRPGSASNGGESGLNIFVNDVRKVRLVEPAPHAAVSEELERLHQLLLRCAISQAEFETLKAKLLDVTPSREPRQ
jgi:hypothetical protein